MSKQFRGLELEPEMYHRNGEACYVLHCFNFPEGEARFGCYPGTLSLYFCPEHTAQLKGYGLPQKQPKPIVSKDEERQRRFTSHDVDMAQSGRMAELRGHCLAMAERLARLVPPGRELATALTKLEEVMFHGVAGIAREVK